VSGAYVNERATAKWVSILLGRGSGAEVGSIYPGHLWVGEVIDHSRAEAIELGERAWQWTTRPWPVFRERIGRDQAADLDSEAQRIAELFADAAAEYAEAERP
jgi:hypothetical protein